ncbi:MAG: single-stranded-DNA-specific exonuclease RecJ [Candidatus Latescibacterota bacterium]
MTLADGARYIAPVTASTCPGFFYHCTRRMRLYPHWDIRHEGPYESLATALLEARGLTPESLQVGPAALHPPDLLLDLCLGVERIARAVRQGEPITVFGDYDVDGITSTVLLGEFLERVGASCTCLLPDRHLDGYGLKPPAVERAAQAGARLIVTVDNGISAYEALEAAHSRGIDVVVVDHHPQLGELPAALAIIDPNRRDCPYPFKGLAGVGVVLKVVQALAESFLDGEERRRYLNDQLDLVALGTVADVMPVLGENRALIVRGLQVLDRTGRPGLRRLKAVAGYQDKPVTTTALAFHLGPRLNVAGRLESAELALRLLRTRSDAEAAEVAEHLNQLNARRQALQRAGLAEAEALLQAQGPSEDRIVVLLGESWHVGIIGLLAGKLAEKHGRPVAVCTADRRDGTYVGSARSIPGYDISAAVSACAGHLLAFGGHPAAAGFTLAEEEFEAFRLGLIEHANAHLAEEDLVPRLVVDLVLRPEDIGPHSLHVLQALEPFGCGHEIPVFAARACHLRGVRQIGREGAHLKLDLEIDGRRCGAVWWQQGALARRLGTNRRVCVAFALEPDTYAPGGGVQMVLRDMYEE